MERNGEGKEPRKKEEEKEGRRKGADEIGKGKRRRKKEDQNIDEAKTETKKNKDMKGR